MKLDNDVLFRRAWKVTVGGIGDDPAKALDVSGLDIEFKILRTIKHEPNKSSVTIYNLTAEHRAELQRRNIPDKSMGIPVSIEAGYENNSSLLMLCDMREVGSVKEGVDYKTTITGDDGGRSFRESRINTQFTKGTPITAVLSQLCNAMGIGLGNANAQATGAVIPGIGGTLPHTLAASGSAATCLDRVIRSTGLTWSIQNGALQLLKKGEPLRLDALLVSPQTGLVGSPQSSVNASVSLGNPQQFALNAKTKKPKKTKPKDTSIVKFKMIIRPGIFPGRIVQLISEQFNGFYFITEVEFVGNTRGQDWYAEIVARLVT